MYQLFGDGSEVPIIEMPSGTIYEVGDIIMFESGGFNVIHRVEYIFTYDGETYYVTEGVNNKFVDDAVISGDQIIGKADFSKETFEAARELAEQNKLRRYTVHALTENQRKIRNELKGMISEAIESKKVPISEVSRILFPDVKGVFKLLDQINRGNGDPREFIKDLVDLIEGINNIGDIDGLNNDDLTYIKQDLLDRCLCIFFKKGLTIKTLETLDASEKIINLVEKYSKHVPYYLFYEKRLAKFLEDSPKVVEDYPKEIWTSTTKTLQKNIFYKLTGGRDIITGKKYLTLPNGRPILDNTMLHHRKTDIENHLERIKDCRLSALIMLDIDYEQELHDDIRKDSDMRFHYADFFEKIITDLLNGIPPKHWDQIDQNEFLAENPNRENSLGLKYLFYY